MSPTHPLGCHRPRIPDRVVFEHVVAALVHGSGYERIAPAGCSDRTIRRRPNESLVHQDIHPQRTCTQRVQYADDRVATLSDARVHGAGIPPDSLKWGDTPNGGGCYGLSGARVRMRWFIRGQTPLFRRDARPVWHLPGLSPASSAGRLRSASAEAVLSSRCQRRGLTQECSDQSRIGTQSRRSKLVREASLQVPGWDVWCRLRIRFRVQCSRLLSEPR